MMTTTKTTTAVSSFTASNLFLVVETTNYFLCNTHRTLLLNCRFVKLLTPPLCQAVFIFNDQNRDKFLEKTKCIYIYNIINNIDCAVLIFKCIEKKNSSARKEKMK